MIGLSPYTILHANTSQFRTWAMAHEEFKQFVKDTYGNGRYNPTQIRQFILGLQRHEWHRALKRFINREKSNPADIPAKYIVDPSLILPSGMSRKQAKRVAELREAYQWSMARRGERKQFTDPAVIADYLIPIMAPLHVEHLCVLPLDSRCKLIEAPHPVTRGDVDGVDAGPRAILRAVLLAGAVQFVVAHNHPTGDVSPSQGDKAVTRRLMEGARAIDIPLRDHIIVGPPNNWCSLMRDHPDLFR